MPFDKQLDKQLDNVILENDGVELHVGKYSYNGGEEKIQIGPRMAPKKNGEMSFRKVGRLTVGEATAVRDALNMILDSNN